MRRGWRMPRGIFARGESEQRRCDGDRDQDREMERTQEMEVCWHGAAAKLSICRGSKGWQRSPRKSIHKGEAPADVERRRYVAQNSVR